MKSVLAIVGCLLLAHFVLSNVHATHPPGVLVAEEPTQAAASDKSWRKSGFTITSLAQFHIRARVISTERYWFDEGSRLSPIDFMLGWGPMSDQSVLDQIAFRQGMRWCTYKPNGKNFPLPMDDINTHSANMHLIPADRQVETELKRVSVGDIVDMRGYLVQVEGANGFKWRSSLSRTDTGNGAC
jgi:hypothetical protein